MLIFLDSIYINISKKATTFDEKFTTDMCNALCMDESDLKEEHKFFPRVFHN